MNPNCRFNHKDWAELQDDPLVTEENSRDYFTDKSIMEILESFDGFKKQEVSGKIEKKNALSNESAPSAASTNENGSDDSCFTCIETKKELRQYLMENKFKNMGDGMNVDGSVSFKANKKISLWDDQQQGTWKALDERKFQISFDGEKEIYQF